MDHRWRRAGEGGCDLESTTLANRLGRAAHARAMGRAARLRSDLPPFHVPIRGGHPLFDPEGLLCIFSASSVTLAGSVAGSLIRGGERFCWKQVGQLAAVGGTAILAGWLAWKFGYPPIKALWTATFDLLAIGISLLVFAVFFALIDVVGWRRWSFPLQVIGVNSLTIDLLTGFVDFSEPAERLFGRFAVATGSAAPVVLAVGGVLIEWLLLWFLHRRKIYLRV